MINTMEEPKPNAINIIHIVNKNSRPELKLAGDCLFESGFLPDKPLVAEIYDNKIIIRPVTEHKNFTVVYKKN